MAIPTHLRRHLEAGSFDTIEDAWLAHLSEDPTDLAFFVGIAKPLASTGEPERASFLLEMLADALDEAQETRRHLELLQQVGHLMFSPEELHPEILETLRKMHHTHNSLEGLMEKLGLHRAPDDIPKTWDKVARLEGILQFEIGSVVWMKDRGAGRVEELNLELESIKIDFERHPGLRVGFRAASKLLRALPPEHILRRKLENLDGLQELKKRDPGELLLCVLQSYDKPRTAGEIRRTLAGIVADKEWTSFWAAARKHPQIVSSAGGGRQTYSWASSTEHALGAVWKSFEVADDQEKLVLFRKNMERSPKLKEQMLSELERIATEAEAGDPGLTLTIWLSLDRYGALPPDRTGVVREILEQAENPVDLLSTLADRSVRERAYAIVGAHRQDGTEVLAGAMRNETETKLLSDMAAQIQAQDPAALHAFADEVLSHPRRRPAAFAWFAERAGDESLLGPRSPLRLLQLLLEAPRLEELKPYRARLLKLYDTGGPFPSLLSRLDADQSSQAEAAIERAPVEEFRRTPLLNALHLRFESLRKEDENRLYATLASINVRRAQLKELLEVEIPENRRAIEEARALGDLSENFEYKSARQRHEYLAARASKLKQDLTRVQVFDPESTGTQAIRVGSQVELTSENGDPKTLVILGPWESEPEKNRFSYDSELGKSLLGKKVGESVLISNDPCIIGSIQPWKAI